MHYIGVCVVLALFVSCDYSDRSSSSNSVKVFGAPGITDGSFSGPRAIEVDNDGTIYVMDKTGRVQMFDNNFTFVRSFRLQQYEKGTPTGFCVAPDGRIFIADTHYSRIVVYDTEGRLLHSFRRLRG